MIKFTNYLIFCGILVLYCCGERNPIVISGSNRTQDDLQTNHNENITLTADEQKIFDALKTGFDTIIEKTKNLLKTHKKNMKPLSQNRIEESQNIVNKYPNFITWLSNNSPQKKKLANAFTTIYNFLEEQRLIKLSKLSSEQFIINTLNCFSANKLKPQCNNQDYAYIDSNLHLKEVFHYLIMSLHIKKTNEEIFENMQDTLLSPNGYLNALIKSFEYEKILRPNLNDNQKQGLDFLKQALSAHNLKKVLRSNEDKIKAVLDHMYNEMTKCNGDDVNKNLFIRNVNLYFNTVNYNQLDKFKDQLISTCGFGGK